MAGPANNQGTLGTSLAELIGAAGRKRTGVPPEIAAFLALEVAEGLASRPAVVETTDVMVTDDGQVAVFPKTSSAPEAQAARAVGGILARILMGGTSVVPPALNALVNRATDGQRGYGDLATLRKDLEAVLIPLNRGAARRVLARFVREVLRAPSPVQSPQPLPVDGRVSSDGIDELLSALAESPQGPPPASPGARRGRSSTAPMFPVTPPPPVSAIVQPPQDRSMTSGSGPFDEIQRLPAPRGD